MTLQIVEIRKGTERQEIVADAFLNLTLSCSEQARGDLQLAEEVEKAIL